jgi:hypothetical protein
MVGTDKKKLTIGSQGTSKLPAARAGCHGVLRSWPDETISYNRMAVQADAKRRGRTRVLLATSFAPSNSWYRSRTYTRDGSSPHLR